MDDREPTTRDQLPDRELVADGLVTIAQAGALLSLSRSMIYKLMRDGRLAFVKFGRSRRIPKRAVIAVAAAALRKGTLG